MKLFNKALFVFIVLSLIFLPTVTPKVFAVDKDTLRIGTLTALKALDPMRRLGTQEIATLGTMYEPLVINNSDGEIAPLLAKSWERPDSYTWIFQIRKKIVFHNGNPLTAQDVAFSLRRSNELQVSEFKFIGSKVKSINIIDDYTLEIKTKVPEPTWIEAILPRLPIMDEEWTKGKEDKFVATSCNGTGPYKLVEWIPESYLKITANEKYHGSKPALKNVIFKPLVEESTRLAALRTGEIDIARFTSDSAAIIEKAKDLELISTPTGRAIYLPLNFEDGPTKNLKVRQAIYMAIDENEIIERILNGFASPATHIVCPGQPGHNSNIQRPKYDPQRAKEILKEAGYEKGFDIVLSCPNDRYIKDNETAVAVASYLQKIGINATVNARPRAAYFPDIKKRVLDFYMIGWSPVPTTEVFNQCLRKINPEKGLGTWNGGKYSNERIEKLMDASLTILDPKKREEMWQQANKLAMDDVAVIPLHYLHTIYGVKKGIQFEHYYDGRMKADTFNWK